MHQIATWSYRCPSCKNAINAQDVNISTKHTKEVLMQMQDKDAVDYGFDVGDVVCLLKESELICR